MGKVVGKGVFAGLIFLSFLCVGGTSAQWKAYNDCLAEGGDFTHANATTWAIYAGNTGNYTGPLKDFETGNSIDTLGVKWFEWNTVSGGSLSNGGEQLELHKPGDIKDLRRMYIRVDRVSYSDGSHPVVGDPWPTEPDDSDDYTLHRKVADDYGNDVINWEATAATPRR